MKLSRFKRVTAVLGIASLAIVGSSVAATAGPKPPKAPKLPKAAFANYSNPLNKNTNGWCTYAPGACDGQLNDYGTIDIVDPSFSNYGGYAPGVPAPTGPNGYARVSGAGNSGATESPTGCSTPGNEDCTGPYITFGTAANAGMESVFPANGFSSSIAIYLDTNWGTANSGQVVEWDVSLNDSTGNFMQDYIFNLCSTASGFSVTASNNAGGCGGVDSPVTVTSSGWYTFDHDFYWASGALNVTMTVLNSAGNVIFTWKDVVTATPGGTTITSPSQLGGPNYGWFPDEDVLGLPVADQTLTAN